MIENLEEKLNVGAKIKIGKKYSETFGNFKEDEIIELVEGEFEYYNGLYTSTEHAPAIWNKFENEYDSIFHLFGNDLSSFLDCTIIKKEDINQLKMKL